MKSRDWHPAVLLGAGTAFGFVFGLTVWEIPDAAERLWQILYDWQTLIAGLLALGAAFAAWKVGQRQVAEQRVSSLLNFLVEEKRRCDETLNQMHALEQWLDYPVLLATLLQVPHSERRLMILRNLGDDSITKESSYDKQCKLLVLKNTPACDHVWRIRFERILERLHGAGLYLSADEDGEMQERFDFESEEIASVISQLVCFHTEVGREVRRMLGVIDTYRRGQALLVKEADAVFRQSAES